MATSRFKVHGSARGREVVEELLIGTQLTGTDHPMILRAMEHSLSWPQLQLLLDDLVSGLEAFDCDRVLNVLAAAVANTASARKRATMSGRAGTQLPRAMSARFRISPPSGAFYKAALAAAAPDLLFD